MTQELKEYIENNIQLIEAKNYAELYSKIEEEWRSELTDVLHRASIHPEQHLDVIPCEFAMGSQHLKDITLSNSCTRVAREAFSNSSLASITLNNKLIKIASGAFEFCVNLTNIKIPDSVKTIDMDAFFGCKNLTEVVLGTSVEVIQNYAFCQCFVLTKITLPLSLKYIGKGVFNKCYELTELTYAGTQDQWQAIEKSPSWNMQNQITTVRCSDGTINILYDL